MFYYFSYVLLFLYLIINNDNDNDNRNDSNSRYLYLLQHIEDRRNRTDSLAARTLPLLLVPAPAQIRGHHHI